MDSEVNVTVTVSFLSHKVIKTWFVSCSKVVVQDTQSGALSYLLLNFLGDKLLH